MSATLDSGNDKNCLPEQARLHLGLPILRKSHRRIGVANGGISHGKYKTKLPIEGISDKAAMADTFDDFDTSLISVSALAGDNKVSIFTKDGVSVHNEEDVLIRVKKKPIMIGVRNSRGQYKVPLVNKRGRMAPRTPSRQQQQRLIQANSVYDLPSTEQAIKWMHATCGYPVKSTWLKAIKAGNYVGWPLLNERNVKKYYPETTETPKGHMNQTRQNVRSTKPKQPLEEPVTTELKRKEKERHFRQSLQRP